MPRARLSIGALLVIAAVVVSCTDRPAPTEAATAMGRRVGANATGCLSPGNLNNLVITVFGTANMPNQNSALHKLDQVTKALGKGNTADAIAKANDLISFIRLKATELAVQAQAQALIEAIECYAGISQNTFLVYPADQQQTITSADGQAGIVLPVNPVTEPTLITITMLDPNSTSPLITKLDKYPGYVEITQQSGVANSLAPNVSVTVAVCPVAGIPDSIASRLRLGHQAAPGAAGFEVTPSADASFLTCAGYASAASKLPGWVRSLASLVMPKPLYARMRFSGGVGGTAEEFSPFGPVDPELSFSGGVGGTAEEFIKEQPASPAAGKKQPSATEKTGVGSSRVRSVTESANIITCYQAEVGASAKATGCRPQVTLKTVNQTPFVGVPVTFTVGATGGSVAADAGSACGALGSSVTILTDVNGVARACWTLGDIAADYTVTATPANGGDAIAGVSFSQASYTWTTTALKKTAVLTLGNLSQTYDGNGKSVTVSTAPVTGLGTINVTYDGVATLPSEAGTHAVVATLSNPSYQGTASGTLTITKATQAALSITAPGSSVYGTTSTLSATGGTGGGAVTFLAAGACSVSGNVLTITSGSGTCAISATRSGGNNYDDVSATLDVATSQAAQAPLAITGAGTIAFGGSDITLGTSGGNGTGAVAFAAASSTACSVTSGGLVHVTTGTGTCEITATKAADANYFAMTSAPATMTITKAIAVLSFGNLTQGYDGTPKAVSVTSAPANLGSVAVTYNGSGSAPTAAGKYEVLATLSNADYEASVAKDTLTITKASQSINFSGLPGRTYGDANFTVSATSTSGLAVLFAVSGNCALAGATTISITGAGSCTVTATQAGDGNFQPAAAVPQDFAVGKAVASVTLGNLTTTYSGSGKSASVATSATGSSTFTVTYGGSETLPINAGNYAVVATLNNANYTGSASGTLVIGKAAASVTLGDLSAIYDGTAKAASATTNASGASTIAITYNGSASAPANAGSYAVVATLGNANYTGSATGTLVINPAGTSITWATPANIILGTALSGTQLNATASTSGSFAYNPLAGTVLPAGTSILNTAFTPSSTNYAANTKSVSIKVFYKQVGCFSSPVYSSMPDTKSYQRKGSNLPIKCSLTTASGAAVGNASGSLKIEDLGTNPNALLTDASPLVIGNAFVPSSNGTYSYGLDTGPSKFIALHYYRATAQWNDGNTTVGFFYIK